MPMNQYEVHDQRVRDGLQLPQAWRLLVLVGDEACEVKKAELRTFIAARHLNDMRQALAELPPELQSPEATRLLGRAEERFLERIEEVTSAEEAVSRVAEAYRAAEAREKDPPPVKSFWSRLFS